MVTMRSFLNFFDMLSSSMRSCCMSPLNTSVSPDIFTPFMEFSIAVVAAMRRSMASSHSAWRCITRLVAPRDPNSDTAPGALVETYYHVQAWTYQRQLQ